MSTYASWAWNGVYGVRKHSFARPGVFWEISRKATRPHEAEASLAISIASKALFPIFGDGKYSALQHSMIEHEVLKEKNFNEALRGFGPVNKPGFSRFTQSCH